VGLLTGKSLCGCGLAFMVDMGGLALGRGEAVEGVEALGWLLRRGEYPMRFWSSGWRIVACAVFLVFEWD